MLMHESRSLFRLERTASEDLSASGVPSLSFAFAVSDPELLAQCFDGE